MGNVVDITTGTTVTFSGWTAQITSLSYDGVERASIETTHLGSAVPGAGFGGKTFIIAKLGDPGTLNLEGHFDPDKIPPVTGAISSCTITWPAADTWVFSAACTSFSMQGPLEDKMTYSLSLKACGAVVTT